MNKFIDLGYSPIVKQKNKRSLRVEREEEVDPYDQEYGDGDESEDGDESYTVPVYQPPAMSTEQRAALFARWASATVSTNADREFLDIHAQVTRNYGAIQFDTSPDPAIIPTNID